MHDTNEPLTLHHGQDRLLGDKRKREHLVLAGVGYGKTIFGPRWHFKRCVDNSRSHESLVIAPDNRLLKRRCLEEYEEYLIQGGMSEGRNRDFQITRSAGDIMITWNLKGMKGNVVHFLTGQSPTKIVSYNASHAWLDESAVMVEQVRKNVIKRVRCPFAEYRQILHTTTPEGLNWLYEIFNPETLTRDGVHSFNEQQLVLHGASFDNPYLDEDYLQTLEDEFGWDSAYYHTYVLGEFMSLSRNRFYYSFDPRTCVGKTDADFDLDPKMHSLVLTFDNNVGQMACAALQSQALGDEMGWAVVWENGSTGRNVDECCEQFAEVFDPSDFKGWSIMVLGDAALHNRSPVSYLTGYQRIEQNLKRLYPNLRVNAPRGNPFVEERSRVTNRCFAQGKLRIHRSCKKTILSARMTESDGRGGVLKPAGDMHTHAMEAIDMALQVLEPLRIRVHGNGLAGIA